MPVVVLGTYVGTGLHGKSFTEQILNNIQIWIWFLLETSCIYFFLKVHTFKYEN